MPQRPDTANASAYRHRRGMARLNASSQRDADARLPVDASRSLRTFDPAP